LFFLLFPGFCHQCFLRFHFCFHLHTRP
jgi:hypothetical protein